MQFLNNMLALVILMACSAFSQHIYYVKTDSSPSSACPAQPCLTLDQYSLQASTYFTTGATFMFLAGNHSIVTSINLSNMSHITFKGEEDPVIVLCRSQWALKCDEVTDLTIERMTFVLQADDHSPPSVLSIVNSRDILFANLTFQGNSDLSKAWLGAVFCNHSEVAIVSCLFTGSTAYDGGAIYAFGSSNITLDGNIFTQNLAIRAGGAIFANQSSILLKETLGNIFLSNSAIEYGGAIVGFKNSSIVIERDNVTLNEETLFPMIAEPDNEMKFNCTNVPIELYEPLSVHQQHIHTTYYSNNKAGFGGAVLLLNNSEALLDGTSIVFHNNSATTLSVEHLSFSEHKEWIMHHYGGELLMQGEPADHYGGAIASQDSLLSLSGNIIIFCENFADGNRGSVGGAIYSHFSTVTSNTKHLCFSRNRAFEGGAYTGLKSNSSFGADGTYIEFDNNYGTYGGALEMRDGTLVLRAGRILFRSNRADLFGGGVFTICTSVLFSGTAIEFANNSASNGGGAVISYSQFDITADEVNFVRNSAKEGGGLFVVVSVISRTKQLNFIGNIAIQSGGMLIKLSNCTFQSVYFINNSAMTHSGAVSVDQSNVSFHNINVTGSSAGAIDIILGNVTFSGNTNIRRNVADIGGGIRATMSSITFIGNTRFEENNATQYGGAIMIEFETTISFSGHVVFNANHAVENGGAIFVTDRATSITLADRVHFTNNLATNGGAMYFENSARVILKKNVTLTTSNNHATGNGGAIYNKDAITPTQCNFSMTNKVEMEHVEGLPSCFIDLFKPNGTSFPYEITSHNDSAKQEGGFLYGGLLDKCQVVVLSTANSTTGVESYLFYPILMKQILDVSSSDSHSSVVASEAYLLCFCDSNQKYYCFESRSVETYRGRKFTVPLLALAQGNTVTSTLLRAMLGPTARSLPNQRAQNLSSYCTNVSYNLYSTEEKESMFVYPDDGPCLDVGLAQAVIDVTFLPCPDAFTLSGDQCVCEKRLQTVKANCTIFDDDFYITREVGSKFWVSALTSNGTYQGLILYPTCPVEYCKTESVNISLAEPDVQCDWNRSGVLCGACVANYSLTLGSSICQACSNNYLALLFPFAAAGIALVVFLSFLRLTVATGMINSIILYANIVQANRNLLFPTFTDTNILTVFVAWTNLDLGFQTCFYRGMDAYAQTWLQFAFPVYVWVLIASIIVTSRYSVTVTKLIGTNPIAVLATLLLMSYAKILKIIIEAFSYVNLEYPGNEKLRVWLKDANVPYLQSKHLVLTVVTTLVVVFFFLPYTLLLLLGYKLYRFSGRRHTRWLIRIKPLLDSYYAPYEVRTRYWTGFLLLVRCALYIVFSYDSLNRTTKSLFAVSMGFTAIIVIAWLSVKIYTNLYTNIIEALVYLDLIALSTATLAGLHSQKLVNSLIGAVFAIMTGIIIYHFHILYIAKSAVWLRVLGRLSLLISRVAQNYSAPTEVSPLLPQSPPRPGATAAVLREPLLTEN